MKKGDTVFLLRQNTLVQAKILSKDIYGYTWIEFSNGQKLLAPTSELQQNEGSQKEVIDYLSINRS